LLSRKLLFHFLLVGFLPEDKEYFPHHAEIDEELEENNFIFKKEGFFGILLYIIYIDSRNSKTKLQNIKNKFINIVKFKKYHVRR